MDKRQLFGLLCDGQGYPQIELVVSSGTNDLMYKSLLEDQVDVAIANFTDASPGIGQRDFYREQVVLAVATSLLQSLYGERADAVVQAVGSSDLSPLFVCPFLLSSPEDINGKIGRNLLK